MAQEPNDAAEQSLRAQAKELLRERLRSLRRVLPVQAAAARSAALCARLCGLPEFASASLVVGYRAHRKEADPSAVLVEAARAGKRIGLPRILEAGALELHLHAEGATLESNALGIEEPQASAERLDLASVDLILVPAIAFDARGHRIGQGHGYYDRLLPRLPRAFKVAVGYDFQLLADLPDQPGDARVDAIVTDARVLRCG
jgi:5-formyltetrahydrofolate cyclo-ligase